MARSHSRLWWIVFLLVFGAMHQIRADGLPGEFLLSPYWRVLTGIHSPLSNPAFMTEEDYLSIRGVYSPVMQRQFRLSELGATLPIGLYQSAGITWIGQFDGEVTPGIQDPDDGTISPAPEGTPTVSNSNHVIMGSYAINPFSRLSFGGNLTYAYQSNFGEPVYGIGLDAGATFRVITHPILGYHLVGVSTINLIAPAMGDAPLPTLMGKGAYAKSLRFSWHATYLEELLSSAVDFELKDFLAAKEEFLAYDSLGGNWKEIASSLEYSIDTRVGGWLFRRLQSYLLLGFDQDALDYWGVSAGARVPSLNQGRELSVEFQYTMKTDGDNSSAFSWYLFGEFGHHREELLARRLARLSDVAPSDLYNKAMKLYKDERYWDAYFVFSQILSQFPDFFKNDWVVHYRGRCQEEMDMREAAMENYQTVLSDYPKSPAVPFADLGLVRISYRQADPEMVENHFDRLSRPGVPDSLRYHGMYYWSESLMSQGNYRKAIQFFSSIPETHPEFPFAQHSLAVAHVLAGDPMPAITEALGRAVEYDAQTPEQIEVINRSFLLFGYLFYEESMLGKAVSALRKVPNGSMYYADAQLGLGWSAIRAKQWSDAVTAGKQLVDRTPNNLLKAEGGLVQAYGLMMNRQYMQALNVLDQAMKRIAAYNKPTEESLTKKKWNYQNTRINYGFLADRMEKLSMKSSSEYALSQIDSLHREQQTYRDSISSYLEFKDRYARESFFSRGYQETKDDLSYAWATVQKYAIESGDDTKRQEILDQQKQLEEEIEQIQREMEEMRNKEQETSPPKATPPPSK